MSSESTGSKQRNDKQKALDSALTEIERSFGKGSIMRLGHQESEDIESISTGSLGLDIALGVGGLPRGRIIEIYGPESSGKTTLALHVIAEAQRVGGQCAFLDAEHALDPSYAKKLGIDLDNLLISQPDTGEQALEIADTLVRSSALDILVIDSVAALVPRAELEGDMGDSHVGLHARLMSQALRKLTGSVSRSRTMIIFINQIRRIGAVKDEDAIVGNQTRVKVVKNKVAPPFRVVEFDIMYDEGISKSGEILDLGVSAGIIDKSGSYYSYESERIAQGREKARTWLRENPASANAIENRIREKEGLLSVAMLESPPPPPQPDVIPDEAAKKQAIDSNSTNVRAGNISASPASASSAVAATKDSAPLAPSTPTT